jgi:hypothetical protein
MKIAIYSCNFGNYRDEFKHYYNVQFDDKIDYFLFTDRNLNQKEIIRLGKWKICTIPALRSDKVMNGSRWMCKHVKFILPNELSTYDIVIWIDNKRFIQKDKMNTITYDQIMEIINKYPKRVVFNVHHLLRRRIQQELQETIRVGCENPNGAKKFLEVVKHYVSTFELTDNCVIIRKNNQQVNEAFAYCFELMKTYELRRDQNVYNYAMDSKNITPMLLGYHDLSFLY